MNRICLSRAKKGYAIPLAVCSARTGIGWGPHAFRPVDRVSCALSMVSVRDPRHCTLGVRLSFSRSLRSAGGVSTGAACPSVGPFLGLPHCGLSQPGATADRRSPGETQPAVCVARPNPEHAPLRSRRCHGLNPATLADAGGFLGVAQRMCSMTQPLRAMCSAMRRPWHCAGSFSQQSKQTGVGRPTRRSMRQGPAALSSPSRYPAVMRLRNLNAVASDRSPLAQSDGR